MFSDFIPTGIDHLDELMGGFRIGDNVLLQAEVGTPPHAFNRAFLAESLRRGCHAFYVSFDYSPATVMDSLQGLPEGRLTLVDCFTHGKGRSEDVFRRFYERDPAELRGVEVIEVDAPHHPSRFHRVFDGLTDGGEDDYFLVDSLTGMAELWREEDRVREFYTHTCPRLFDMRALAVWVLNTRVHSEAFCATIGHIAQVVISLQRDGAAPTLTIERAVGRSRPGIHHPHPYTVTPAGVRLSPPGPASSVHRTGLPEGRD